ncbi:hypothetical protein, partial [Salmonella enterica]
ITGDVNLSADYAKEDKIDSGSPLTGVSVSGNNNDITLDGALNFDVNAQTSATEQIVGLNVNGDNNSVRIDGGINVNHNSSEDSNVSITAINIDGDSQVILSGQSSIDTTTIVGGMVTLAEVNNGGS